MSFQPLAFIQSANQKKKGQEEKKEDFYLVKVGSQVSGKV